MIQVLLDRREAEVDATRDAMLLTASRFAPDEVVSFVDPRGLNGLADPLFVPPATHNNKALAAADDQQQQHDAAFTGLAFEGSPSELSFEVEVAEFWPDLKCYSEFYPVGRFKNPFLRLCLPSALSSRRVRGEGSTITHCMFRVRSRVEAPTAPEGCVRSLWSPIVSWREPTPPPPVYHMRVTAIESERRALVEFLHSAAPFHNQSVFEVMVRESETPAVPPSTQIGANSRVAPYRDSPVLIGPLKTQRYHHIRVRVVTTFGRSEWSPWHSVSLAKQSVREEQRGAAVPCGSVTRLLQAGGASLQHRSGPDKSDAHATLVAMTSSEWDSQTAWGYPYPVSRTTDGFPCLKDSCFHFSAILSERVMRKSDAEQTVHVDAMPTFVAAGTLRQHGSLLSSNDVLGRNAFALDDSASGSHRLSSDDDESNSPAREPQTVSQFSGAVAAAVARQVQQIAHQGVDAASPPAAEMAAVSAASTLLAQKTQTAAAKFVPLRRGNVAMVTEAGLNAAAISPSLDGERMSIAPPPAAVLAVPSPMAIPSPQALSVQSSPGAVPLSLATGDDEGSALAPDMLRTLLPQQQSLHRMTMEEFLHSVLPPKPPAVPIPQAAQTRRASVTVSLPPVLGEPRRPSSARVSSRPYQSRHIAPQSNSSRRTSSDAETTGPFTTAADRIFETEDPFAALRFMKTVVLPGSTPARGYSSSPRKQK